MKTARYEFPEPESCNKCYVSYFWNRRYGDGQELPRRRCGITNTDCTDYTETRAPFCPLKIKEILKSTTMDGVETLLIIPSENILEEIVPKTPEGELKPCPFCGGEANVVHLTFTGNGYLARCDGYVDDDCIAASNSVTHRTREEAIAAWNRREGK